MSAARVVLPGAPLVNGATALRPWRDSDLDAIVAACQDPAIARWTPIPVPYRSEDARAFLLGRYDSIHAAAAAPFAIVAATGGLLLGSVSLARLELDERRGEVGYWLAGHARGQGHATRAVRTICAFGFTTLGLERIGLGAASDNHASQRVAERAGFTREAVLRSYLVGRLGREDIVSFSLLRTDPAAAALLRDAGAVGA